MWSLHSSMAESWKFHPFQTESDLDVVQGWKLLLPWFKSKKPVDFWRTLLDLSQEDFRKQSIWPNLNPEVCSLNTVQKLWKPNCLGGVTHATVEIVCLIREEEEAINRNTSLLNMGESWEFKESGQGRRKGWQEPRNYIAAWKLWRSTLQATFQVS